MKSSDSVDIMRNHYNSKKLKDLPDFDTIWDQSKSIFQIEEKFSKVYMNVDDLHKAH